MKFKLMAYFITVFTIVVATLIAYLMVPIILNYPTLAENAAFQRQIETLTHIEQYMILGSISIVIMFIVVSHLYKNIFRFVEGKAYDAKNFKEQCFAIPRKIVLSMQVILITLLIISSLGTLVYADIMMVLKVFFAVYALFSAGGIISSIWHRKILKEILVRYAKETGDYEVSKQPKKFSTSAFFQIMPLTLIVFVVITLYGYTNASNRIGDASFFYYQNLGISNLVSAETKDSLISSLREIPKLNDEDYFFVFNDDFVYVEDGNELSLFMKQYTREFAAITDGRVHEFYGVERQGFVELIRLDTGEEFYVGFTYRITDGGLVIAFVLIFFVSVLIFIFLISIWIYSTASNVKEVTKNLLDIANDQNVNNEEKLPIISNDEFGLMTDAYNKIQDLTLNKQDIMVKQGQLVTLGELAGGMAHDINTPISAINYGIDTLNKQLTDPGQKEIMLTMKQCTNKIISIVNDLRNQIRNLGSADKESFKLLEIINESRMLVQNKLDQFKCKLTIEVDEELELYGERNKFGQVITNMLMNSIQAYGRNNIPFKDITITGKIEGRNAVIKVIDFAGGIPEKIQETLFKEIMTTKGTEGTGIGMYLAYSIIRGGFNGDIRFETIGGKSTTFIITIPIDGIDLEDNRLDGSTLKEIIGIVTEEAQEQQVNQPSKPISNLIENTEIIQASKDEKDL